jgi:hypothetical protein
MPEQIQHDAFLTITDANSSQTQSFLLAPRNMAFCRPASLCGPPIGQIVSKLRSKPPSNVALQHDPGKACPAALDAGWVPVFRRDHALPSLHVRKGELCMAYRIVAERENETVRMDRMSSLMALAKARVWASEGWDVTIIVRDEDELAPAPTDRLLLV